MKRITLTAEDGRQWNVPLDRLERHHTITIKPDGWRMAHNIECDLVRCPFDESIAAWDWKESPGSIGVYRWFEPHLKPWRWVQEY